MSQAAFEAFSPDYSVPWPAEGDYVPIEEDTRMELEDLTVLTTPDGPVQIINFAGHGIEDAIRKMYDLDQPLPEAA
jgi:hypothetical protein